jgi:hypothetical protein
MSKSILKQIVFVLGLLCLFVVNIFPQNMFRKINDFDGDGKADFVVIRNVNNQTFWYVWRSSQGFMALPWGLWTDDVASGDYDGDGKTDIAVVRKTFDINTFSVTFNYYIIQSSTNTFITKIFNTPFISDTNYSTIHQDYDGDGKTDIAISQSTLGSSLLLRVIYSSNNSVNNFTLPVGHFLFKLGDMTGDNRSDSVSYFPINYNGNLTITNLANNSTKSVQFGTSSDRYVPADFDGDGIGDLVVWRESEGNWYWLRSSDGTFRGFHWGQSGDIPIPADYDNDGITDFAIWRAESGLGTYWVNTSSGGFTAFQWGLATDKPVNY